MRVLLCGYGSMGRRHEKNAIALGHEVAIYDPAYARHAEQALAVIVETWRPDAAVIATPIGTHATVATNLLSAGYRGPLFCEKALASSVDEAQVFTAWPHKTTQVGYNLRFQCQARTLIFGISPAESVECQVKCDMGTWPSRSYGHFLGECSHEIDLVLACGVSEQVRCSVMGHASATIILGAYPARGLVQIDASSSEYCRAWSGIGDSGLLYRWRFTDPSELGEGMYLDELAHFLDCAENGVATCVPFADGFRVLRVIEQARAIAAGEPLLSD